MYGKQLCAFSPAGTEGALVSVHMVCGGGVKEALDWRRKPQHRRNMVFQDGKDAQGHATTKHLSRLTHGLVTEPNFCSALGAKVGDAENMIGGP